MSLSSPRPGLPGLQELRHAGHLQDALPGGVQGGRRGQGDVRARGAGEVAGGPALCRSGAWTSMWLPDSHKTPRCQIPVLWPAEGWLSDLQIVYLTFQE